MMIAIIKSSLVRSFLIKVRGHIPLSQKPLEGNFTSRDIQVSVIHFVKLRRHVFATYASNKVFCGAGCESGVALAGKTSIIQLDNTRVASIRWGRLDRSKECGSRLKGGDNVLCKRANVSSQRGLNRTTPCGLSHGAVLVVSIMACSKWENVPMILLRPSASSALSVLMLALAQFQDSKSSSFGIDRIAVPTSRHGPILR
jgi:hypothetical protein